MDALQLQLVHRIPGRLRLALERTAPPRGVEGAAQHLRAQPGVSSVTANLLTRRLLVLHDETADLSAFIAPDPGAAALDAPNAGPTGAGPANRQFGAAHRALREDLRSSLPAGALLTAALTKNYLLGGAGRALFLDYAAVAATGYSVLRHGGGGLTQRLTHPDTVASILLLVASQPAQLLTAALVMWVLNIGEIVTDHLHQEAAAQASGKGSALAAGDHPLMRVAARLPGGLGDQVRALGFLLQ